VTSISSQHHKLPGLSTYVVRLFCGARGASGGAAAAAVGPPEGATARSQVGGVDFGVVWFLGDEDLSLLPF
jgi:hypothetical protein